MQKISNKKLILLVSLLSTITILAAPLTSLPKKLEELNFSIGIKKSLRKGNIYSKSVVTGPAPNIQDLDFKIAGIHPKSCRFALRKLALYENYKDYLDFVKESSYRNGRVRFLLVSSILPIRMILAFKLPRIKEPGVYHYSFDRGFLQGLKGEIHISATNQKKNCFFYSTAKWRGKDTGYGNMLFEFFSSALAKLAMENLIRVSKTY